MNFDGIGPKDFFKAISAKVRSGEKGARKGIEDRSPLNRLTGKYSKPDGFTANNRKTAESLAGQVQAHHLPKGFPKATHSTNSRRAAPVLKGLIENQNPILGLNIHDSVDEASEVTLKTNTQEGHDAFANMFKAADSQRIDDSLAA